MYTGKGTTVLLLAAALAVSAVLAACDAEGVGRKGGRVEKDVYDLKVLVLENRSVKKYGTDEIRGILETGAEIFEKEFGRKIRIADVKQMEDGRAGDYCVKMLEHPAWEKGRGAVETFLKGGEEEILNYMVGNYMDGTEWYKKVVPVNRQKEVTDETMVAEFLAGEYVSRREKLYSEAVPALYPNRERTLASCMDWYLEWIAEPYDLVITNDFLNSANESSLRTMYYGGMESGHAPYNPKTETRAQAIISTFPYQYSDMEFLSDTYFSRLTEEDKKREIGIIIAHELGHSLVHEGHVYEDWNCVMNHNYIYPMEEKEWEKFYSEIGKCGESRKFFYYDLSEMNRLFREEDYSMCRNHARRVMEENPEMDWNLKYRFNSYAIDSLAALENYEECVALVKEMLAGDRPVDANLMRRVNDTAAECVAFAAQKEHGAEKYGKVLEITDAPVDYEKISIADFGAGAVFYRLSSLMNLGMYGQCVEDSGKMRKEWLGEISEEAVKAFHDVVAKCREGASGGK